jgi:L,D-peptidoglycan transpeptidase YkuD (ErfK/YbiS/YcfS/YnhG family)
MVHMKFRGIAVWSTEAFRVLIISSLVLPVAALAKPAGAVSALPVVGTNTKQLIITMAPSWNSNTATMSKFSRTKKGWVQEGPSWPARLGAKGVAWGRGEHPADPPSGSKMKVEGDKRAPAGVFRFGTTFGFAAEAPPKSKMPYSQATNRDLLVEDPNSPDYNRWVRLDHPAASAWEIANAMTLDDPAHELKTFVEHNTSPHPIPGAGSAILLHVWRPNTDSFTSGCTAMDRQTMFDLVTWMDPAKQPRYVLLTQSVYDSVAKQWGLPTQLISPKTSGTPSTAPVKPIPVAAAPTIPVKASQQATTTTTTKKK